MKNNWSVTYECWDDDAREVGETNDRGFIYDHNATFRQALEASGGTYASYEAAEWPIRAPRSFRNYEYNKGTAEWFTAGVDEERCLHVPDHITPASRRRIARLLGCL